MPWDAPNFPRFRHQEPILTRFGGGGPLIPDGPSPVQMQTSPVQMQTSPVQVPCVDPLLCENRLARRTGLRTGPRTLRPPLQGFGKRPQVAWVPALARSTTPISTRKAQSTDRPTTDPVNGPRTGSLRPVSGCEASASQRCGDGISSVASDASWQAFGLQTT